MLELRNISFRVGGFTILRDISLVARPREVTALIGPNGSGKTTLFNIVSGFLRPTGGTVLLHGTEVGSAHAVRRVHLGLGRLWQDVRLFGKMTCLENILVAAKGNPGDDLWRCILQPGTVGSAWDRAMERAQALLELTGLQGKRDVEAENLSVGQQKLLALARLFMNESSILLLDEPFAGVHVAFIEKIQHVISTMKKEGRTILVIEHNISLIRPLAERMFALDRGFVIASGTTEQVCSSEAVRDAYAGI